MRKSSDLLINIRLFLYSIAFFHLLFAAIVILSIDMSQDEDPRISVYIHVRWKLLTCWYHILLLVYYPISLYCDWKEKQGKWNKERVRSFRQIRYHLMTGILFPIIMFGDLTFWLLWAVDPTLIGPAGIFRYLPVWGQHSMHTVSGVKVMLDILLIPRSRPKNWLFNAALTVTFVGIYSAVIAISVYQGEILYSLFEILNSIETTAFVLFCFTEISFFYVIQWRIIDYVWGRQRYENGVNGVGNHKIKSH